MPSFSWMKAYRKLLGRRLSRTSVGRILIFTQSVAGISAFTWTYILSPWYAASVSNNENSRRSRCPAVLVKCALQIATDQSYSAMRTSSVRDGRTKIGWLVRRQGIEREPSGSMKSTSACPSSPTFTSIGISKLFVKVRSDFSVATGTPFLEDTSHRSKTSSSPSRICSRAFRSNGYSAKGCFTPS